jgi:TonB family protein
MDVPIYNASIQEHSGSSPLKRTLTFGLPMLLLCSVHLLAQTSPRPTDSKAQSQATDQNQQSPQVESSSPGELGLGHDDKPAIDNKGCEPSKSTVGPIDVLSDTKGVDFGPYLERVLHDVKMNWYQGIPEEARPPINKKGKVSICFSIMKDGHVSGLRYEQGGSSGDAAFDRAAWGGITASDPFPPLPTEFTGQYLALRFHFYYNPDKGDLDATPTMTAGDIDVLSDTKGVDFGPYLERVLHDVKINWYNLTPESARPPIMKKGKVSIYFAIMKDGRVAGMRFEQGGSSGDIAFDRAAWGGITASDPFPPLPTEFGGEYLALRFHFYYNSRPGEIGSPALYTQEQPTLGAKCSAYIKTKVEDLESKRVPLPPHECAEVLAWMRDPRVERLYTSDKPPQ